MNTKVDRCYVKIKVMPKTGMFFPRDKQGNRYDPDLYTKEWTKKKEGDGSPLSCQYIGFQRINWYNPGNKFGSRLGVKRMVVSFFLFFVLHVSLTVKRNVS